MDGRTDRPVGAGQQAGERVPRPNPSRAPKARHDPVRRRKRSAHVGERQKPQGQMGGSWDRFPLAHRKPADQADGFRLDSPARGRSRRLPHGAADVRLSARASQRVKTRSGPKQIGPLFHFKYGSIPLHCSNHSSLGTYFRLIPLTSYPFHGSGIYIGGHKL